MVDLIKQDFTTNKILYSQIANKLTSELGGTYPINHVGSTAIPNMYGKNIIDILVGAKDETEFNYLSQQLENIGYFPSTKSKTTVYQFFASTEAETGSGDTHIHLSIIGSNRYEEFLILRDYLLANPEEAETYSNHKQEILALENIDRQQYKNIKSQFVSSLIDRAKNNLTMEYND